MNQRRSRKRGITRRALLQRSLATLGWLLPAYVSAGEGTAATAAAMASIVGKRAVTQGGIKLITPAIAENGNTVPLSVEVEGAFTPDRYVKAIHVFAEDNPSPEVISFFFTPAAGRAKVASRIRLAKTQRVIALAEMSDDRMLETANEVKVTIGGCGG